MKHGVLDKSCVHILIFFAQREQELGALLPSLGLRQQMLLFFNGDMPKGLGLLSRGKYMYLLFIRTIQQIICVGKLRQRSTSVSI